MFKNTFAVKFGTSKNDKRFKKLMAALTKYYPEFSVEGLTKSFRGEKVKSISSTFVPGLGSAIEIDYENKDLICFGVSKKFDASFETRKATKICGINVVKVLDIKKDFKEILKRLGSYLASKYPEQSAANILNGWEKTKKIVRYTHYVSVDGVCMSNKKFNKLKKSKKNRIDSISSLINQLI